MRASRFGLTTLLGAGLLLAGCQSSGERHVVEATIGPYEITGGAPDVGVVPTITDATEFVFPLDAYMLSDIQFARLTKAQLGIAAECMKRFGLAYQVPDTDPIGHRGSNDNRYYLTSLERAKIDGYRSSMVANGDQQGADNVKSLGPAGTMVLFGEGQSEYRSKEIPKGGCLGEGSRKLAEGAPELGALAHGFSPPSTASHNYASLLGNNARDRADNDRRVRQAIQGWSECMAAKGYHYRTPADPPSDGTVVAGGRTPTDKEIRIAVADVGCKHEVNLVGIWYSVDVAYQERAIEQHLDELELVEKSLEIQLRNVGLSVDVGAVGTEEAESS